MSNASNLLSLVAIVGTGGFLLSEFGATPQLATPVVAQEEVAAPAPETAPEGTPPEATLEPTTPEGVTAPEPLIAEVPEVEAAGGFHGDGKEGKEMLDPKDGKEMLPPIAAGPESGTVPSGFLTSPGIFGGVALPSNSDVISE